jgi:cyclohexadieny/prephenate dehydrogenase
MSDTGKPLFGRIALIGIGLIGSSIAHATRRGNLAGHIAGYAPGADELARARKIGFADSWHDDLVNCVTGADLIVLAAPVGAFAEIAKTIGPHLKPGAIVSDTGSVKAVVVREVAGHMRAGTHLIPAHPVSGSEQSGPEAGFAELFDGRWCILTPPDGADAAAVEKLSTFWERLGSHVEIMEPKHHDLVLAITSHLPHLIAYNIVGTANHLEQVTNGEVIKYSAGGFRDFTRIAASDPVMWRDVFLNNREAVLEMLGRFSEDLTDLQRAIRYGDGDFLFDLFTRTRAIRRSIVDAGQDTAAPNFGRNADKPER